jgi:hypothetical protein
VTNSSLVIWDLWSPLALLTRIWIRMGKVIPSKLRKSTLADLLRGRRQIREVKRDP